MGGAAVLRAADAMLRAMGGEEIALVIPLPTSAADTSSQLGLADPGVQRLPLAPVLTRDLTTPATGPSRRLEFLVSASAVASTVDARGLGSADALFDAALALQYQGHLFHIESATTDYFAGMAYLYRLIAVE